MKKNLKEEVENLIKKNKYDILLATAFSNITKKSPDESLEIINKLFNNSISEVEKKMDIINSNNKTSQN